MLVIGHQDQIIGGAGQTTIVKCRVIEGYGLRDLEPEGAKLGGEFVHERLERELCRRRHILKINADAHTAMVTDELEEILDGSPPRGRTGKHRGQLRTLPLHAFRIEVIDQRDNREVRPVLSDVGQHVCLLCGIVDGEGAIGTG